MTWKWVKHEGATLRDIGILEDGSVHNPNGYPEETVRAAVQAANARRHERRSDAAKKAAVTRARRRERLIIQVAPQNPVRRWHGSAAELLHLRESSQRPAIY